MPCKMHLRKDQTLHLRQKYSSNQVGVFAPAWVKEALVILGKLLDGTEFCLYERKGKDFVFTNELLKITDTFNGTSLLTLQKVARNESANVTGVIDKLLYSDILDRSVLYSLRDLVRQTVIVGVDKCSIFGGYGCCLKEQPNERVYVCDLAALQFQNPYNSGRLVLVQEQNEHAGIIDDLIFEKIVGESKPLYSSVLDDWSKSAEEDEVRKRYVRHDGFGLPGKGSCFLDTKAYSSFVKADVVLTGLAITRMVEKHNPNDKIHFKFLKYGTGFFAWKFATMLDTLILHAVLEGLDELFQKPKVLDAIKHVELPFYRLEEQSCIKIEEIKSKYNVEIVLSQRDALEHSQNEGWLIATTNCGDNHAPCGNEMNYGSVDAAIAENLESKGNLFSPHINQLMSEEYIDLNANLAIHTT